MTKTPMPRGPPALLPQTPGYFWDRGDEFYYFVTHLGGVQLMENATSARADRPKTIPFESARGPVSLADLVEVLEAIADKVADTAEDAVVTPRTLVHGVKYKKTTFESAVLGETESPHSTFVLDAADFHGHRPIIVKQVVYGRDRRPVADADADGFHRVWQPFYVRPQLLLSPLPKQSTQQ